jgi:hypothetical protein
MNRSSLLLGKGTGASFDLQQHQQPQTNSADVCNVRDVSDKQHALPLDSVLAMTCLSDSAARRLAFKMIQDSTLHATKAVCTEKCHN